MATVRAPKTVQNVTATPDRATLERMLYFLKLTREAEWRIEQVLYRQGKIVGGVYTSRGQEAITVELCKQLFVERKAELGVEKARCRTGLLLWS